MKVTINIDCSPIEARQFLGLPDITQAQEKMMKSMEEQMLDHVRNLDPETFVKTWMPIAIHNFGDIQKMFWSQLGLDPEAQASSKQETKQK